MAKTYLISRTCVFTVYIDQEIDAESEEEALEKFEEMENHGDFDHERIEDIVNGSRPMLMNGCMCKSQSQ